MDATAIIRLALGVISDRLITIIALLTSCGLTSYTLWAGSWERVATLAIYVVFAYATVTVKEKRNDTRQETSTST
jgi:membrane-associated PAP2 superfamily phosphatase